MQTHYYFTPTNLNLDELIENHPPFEGFNKDIALNFISQIYEVISYDYDRTNRHNGYVTLNAKRLEVLGIRNLKKYKEWFENTGVIYISKRYQVGHESMKFKLSSR